MEDIKNLETLRGRVLLTRQEAAAYIGISIVTMQKVMNQRDFPAVVRIGNGRGRVFIHREKLEKWLEDQAGR